MTIAECISKHICCLTNDFNILYDSIIENWIRKEFLITNTLKEPSNPVNCFHYMYNTFRVA